MTFSDHPVIAEDCKKSRKFSCPYIEKNLVLTAADRAQSLYDRGAISDRKLSETISLLENETVALEEKSCPCINTENCPVCTSMDEAKRLSEAYECNNSTAYICPHLRVSSDQEVIEAVNTRLSLYEEKE
jgi:hypothetical protein